MNRQASIQKAFSLANIAMRIVEASEKRTAYIKKEKGKWCVKSPNNPKWSGGCYDTKAEAEKRLGQVEMFKHMKKGAEEVTDPGPGRRRQQRLRRPDCPWADVEFDEEFNPGPGGPRGRGLGDVNIEELDIEIEDDD
jgi:hypothetical protein